MRLKLFRLLAVLLFAAPVFAQLNCSGGCGVTAPVTAVNGGTGQQVYAVGDLLTADTTTSIARVADVATGSLLASGGANTIPAYSTPSTLGLAKYTDSRFKIITGTKNLADADGATQAFTGCGFAPTALIETGSISGVATASWGFAESSPTAASTFSPFGASGTYASSSPFIGAVTTSTTAYQTATVTTWGADGFTLTWSKTGSPSGTFDIKVFCIK